MPVTLRIRTRRHPLAPGSTSSEDALERLRAGNARYAAGRPLPPRGGDGERRRALAVRQQPFAVVLGCIDSRVPPERVFDVGLGDLVCIRTAGQALDEAVLGSIEFGVTELGATLVVVLGHERCGAVAAAVERVRSGRAVRGHLTRVIDELTPAAAGARPLAGDWLENAVSANVARVQRTLRADRAFDPAVVVGARFDLDTGEVVFRR
ncbi:carbonic anhydrase [Streptomyces sp. NPDC051567]|uniref:carbonic anhydrase n=1 Tax=Streptomyces sp. NPDC051567 TaxID=3365660 RepID=UPI0037975F88